MVRATYRFREHTLTPAPELDPTAFAMQCKHCGESSDSSENQADGSEWATGHLKANPGHLAYTEVIGRAYRFVPGEWQ